jgi:GT2 family glycosyltransferase
VAVVILNYNGSAHLSRFLPFVLQYSAEATVWVADNGSTDNSVAMVRRDFPAVGLLLLPANAGYAGGYNQALRRIRADFYVLLNSDVEVTPGWLTAPVALLRADAGRAACQPVVRSWHERGQFEHAGAAGGYLDWLGYAFCRGRLLATLETDTGQYANDAPVFWATGACLFVRASAFWAADGFDTDFFAHFEEIDWCWRVQRLGYSVWTCGQSTVYHVGGGTLPVSSPRKTYLNFRNSLWMLYKNLPVGRLVGVLLLRLVLDGGSAMLFARSGQWADIGAILRAHGDFYRALPRLHRQRATLRRTATHPVRLYGGSLVWQYFALGRHTFGLLRPRP